MTAVVLAYPANLPAPQTAPMTSADRRALQDGAGPFEARAIQRDRLAAQSLTWPAMTRAQIEAFDAWGRTDLEQWGNWFAAPGWPNVNNLNGGVRQFLGRPRFQYVATPEGLWQASATVQIRGATLPPVLYPLPDLGLHFNADVVDTSGRSLRPLNFLSGGGDTDPYPPTPTPGLFGRQAMQFGSYQDAYLGHRGDFNLNASGEWSVSAWVNFDAPGALGPGGTLLQLVGEAVNGSVAGPGGPSLQFSLAFIGAGSTIGVQFSYPFYDKRTGLNGDWHLPDAVLGSPVYLDAGWNFVAIVGDAVSTRGYINGQIAYDDHEEGVTTPGNRPMWGRDGTGQAGFTDQTYWMASAFAGGFDGTVWPHGCVGSASFGGAVQDLRVVCGIGAVDFHGDTSGVPSVPFRPTNPS